MSEFSHGPTPPEFVVTKPLPEISVPSAELMSSLKTPQELTNERIQRLEELAKDFDDEKTSSALRVYDFLQHENDSGRKPWRKYLKNTEDWTLYHQLNPNWQGLNQTQIINENEGYAFLGAFKSWAKEKYGDFDKDIIRIVFPNDRKEWSDLKTIELWQEKLIEEKQSPEWNHTDKKIRNNYKKNFKQQFNDWIQKTIKDPIEKEKIYIQLFPAENKYDEFDSLEEFEEEYKKNPKWKDISLTNIALPENRYFSIFYNHLRKFSLEKYSNLPKEEQAIAAAKLRDKIIEPKYKFKNKSKEWTKFTTVEEWLSEKEKLGWANLNREEIVEQGGYLFNKGYSKFIMERSKDISPHKQKRFLNKMRVAFYGKTLGEYSHLDSEKEFVEEFQTHPEWQNKSITEICKIGGEAFYREFNQWAEEEVFNLPEEEKKTTKRQITDKIFPARHKGWSEQKQTRRNLTEKIFPVIEKIDQTKKSTVIQENTTNIPTNQNTPHIIEPRTKTNNISKERNTKVEYYPEITIPISSGKSISFDDKEDINFSDGFTLENVETTSTKTNGNGTNNIRYSISVDNLTDSQRLRFLTGREDQNPELYAKNIGQLATYVVHRGEIGFLLNLFSQNNLNFPKVIADLGAGPSTAYSAYEQLSPTIQEYGFSKPQIIDVEKNSEMRNFGKNPNKIESDITQKISLEDQSIDMVQSTFVINHFKSPEIYQTLSEANRITKNGGYLSIICSRPFSQSFLNGVESLGYQVITDHGDVLIPNNQMITALSQEFDTETAKRFQNRFNSSFILFAKKNTDVSAVNQLPSPEAFTFDQTKKNHREIKDSLDLKNYNIDSLLLIKNIERITDFIVDQLQQLEVSPLRQEGGLIPGGNEIKSSYEIFNGNLDLIQPLYNKIKNKFNTLTPEQVDQFNQLKEQLRTADRYKKDFYQRHIR